MACSEMKVGENAHMGQALLVSEPAQVIFALAFLVAAIGGATAKVILALRCVRGSSCHLTGITDAELPDPTKHLIAKSNSR